MRAIVESVERRAAGSVLVAAITSGSTALQVDSAADFDSDGGTVTVTGHTLTYTGVLYRDEPDDAVVVDTLQLFGTAGFSAPARATRVDVPGSVDVVASVRLEGSLTSEEARVDHPLLGDLALKPQALSDGALVRCERRSGRLWVAGILNREAQVRPETIAAGVITAHLRVSGSLQLVDGGEVQDQAGDTLMKSDDTGQFPSAMGLLEVRVAQNTSDILALQSETGIGSPGIDGGTL